MELTFKNKIELYTYIVQYIKDDLKSKSLTADSISVERYCINRRQYFYLKKLAKGEVAPDVSDEKLFCLMEKLKLKFSINYIIDKMIN